MSLLAHSAFKIQIKDKLQLLSGATVCDHLGNALVTESGGVDVSAIDTTATLGTSDAVVPSQAAVKTYVDAAVGASTAAEIAYQCDNSANVSKLTSSGAVPATSKSVELKHSTTPIAATIATMLAHPGIFVIKNTSATGTAAHTVTITTGTLDGTNKVATLDAPGECLVVWIDSEGNGVILENIGSVGLS